MPTEGIVNQAVSVLVVTLIEAAAFYLGVDLWFAVSPLVGVLVWTVITYIEHFVAQNLGWGNSLFKGFPFFISKP